MPKLNQAIPPATFENIRMKLGEILADELANQASLIGDDELDATLWIDRNTAFSTVDYPAINIQYNTANRVDANARNSTFEYLYYIDVHTKAPSTNDKLGGIRAKETAERIMGLVRSILEHPVYATLDLDAGIVHTREVTSAQMGEKTILDVEQVAFGRIVFKVQAVEANLLAQGITAAGNDTHATLNETPQGYFFSVPTT